MRFLRKIIMVTCFLLYIAGSILGVFGEEPIADVYIIELHGEVNDTMASYLERELNIAYQNQIPAIIDIDTWGGLLVSADKITNILLNTPVETTAYVSGKAISAGVILTIACDNIALAPSAYIGAAEPIPSTEKILSAWKGMLSTAAIQNGRPEEVIHAMADSSIIIDGYSKEGKLLTLSSQQALSLGVCDVLCDNVADVVSYFELGETFEVAPRSLSDKVASIITSSRAMDIFFTLGFVFMIIEIFTAGFGVAGAIAIICFIMYFFGGFIAGSAQWWSIALFVIGAMALLIEIFIPGFGVFGITGFVMCTLGLVFSANSLEQFTTRAGIAMIVCIVLIPICIAIFGKIKLFDRITNKEVQNVSDGYIVNQIGQEVIGQKAITVTQLRPIGIIELDGERMDAFSGEGFIPEGAAVVITGKKSSSVIVRKEKQK